jgi:8-oxo-dGTP pyrophosphatase MutT (NUDIX family)
MIKEATASTALFHLDGDGVWRTGLVLHPRLQDWMLPGGHVESDESASEAALREVKEETGLDSRLISGPTVPLPAAFPHRELPKPWWVTEMRARADNHTADSHCHIDHVFLAVVTSTTVPAGVEPAHLVRWFTEVEVAAEPGVPDDCRVQLKELFGVVGEAAAAAV